ncbi:MAG: hypothetical protein Ct9H90mP4_10970 [Gammaproteobacteria bacterium]|nr:MAG: hypothetical protein Ct9H90mP4_10970 [Gammaproteobacteria bacterium]
MIESYLYLLVTIIGLIIGSFLNTLIFGIAHNSRDNYS